MKFTSLTAALLLALIFSAAGVSAQQRRANRGEGAALGRANTDANGDGLTDWMVARGAAAIGFAEDAPVNLPDKIVVAKSYRQRARLRKQQREEQSQTSETPTNDNPLVWFTNVNNAGGAFISTQLGTLQSDQPILADFDGDGKTDTAVWRAGASGAAGFFILQSSNGATRFEAFGADGDDPTVTGDYDGDRKADAAVFRCPLDAAAQCYFLYRGTLNNPNRVVTTVPFGFGTLNDLTAAPGDYDGDGKYDFCIQRTLAGGAGQFILQKSSDGAAENINWGLFSDTIVPGDFDGDGKADFMVTRNQNGNLAWYLLTRTGGGTGASPIIWGLSDTDYETPGDYDGDGKTDVAVWRTDADPDANFYNVRLSSNSKLLTFEWGKFGDYPMQNWYVH